MNGCSVVQMIESHRETFLGATSGKKITKGPTCMVEVGTIVVGGLQTPLRQHPKPLKVLTYLRLTYIHDNRFVFKQRTLPSSFVVCLTSYLLLE
jgi:hypothetical protein